MSCSTTTTECSRAISFSSTAVAAVSASVMPATGSSTSSSFGSCASSMPISSHCFCPCDSEPACQSRTSVSRMRSRMRSTVRFVSAVGARRSVARTERGALAASRILSLDRMVLEHGRLLKLAADAERGDGGLVEQGQIVPALEIDLAGVRPRLAGDDVHHRRLAGAVGADDRAHLARRQHQRQPAQRAIAVERHLHVVEIEQRRGELGVVLGHVAAPVATCAGRCG